MKGAWNNNARLVSNNESCFADKTDHKIMSKRGELIEKWSLLGINFYERFQLKKTIFSKYARISREYEIHSGLCVLVKEKPKNSIYYVESERTEMLFEIFSMTLINLFDAGVIDITRFVERKRCFFGFADYEYSIYKIRKIKEPNSQGLFTTMLINQLSANMENGVSLQFLIKKTIDQLLVNKYYGDPTSSFFEFLTSKNNRLYGWPDIIYESKLMGLVKNQTYSLTEEKRITLQKEYNNIRVKRGQLSRDYMFFRALLLELRSLVIFDVRDRLPPDNN